MGRSRGGRRPSTGPAAGVRTALAAAVTVALLACGSAGSEDGEASTPPEGPSASRCPEGRFATRDGVPDAYRACEGAGDCTHAYDGCCRGVRDVAVARRYAACVQTAPCEQPGRDNVCPAVEPAPPACVGGLCE